MDMKRYYWCEGCGVPIHNKGRCTECRIRLHEKAVAMRKRMDAKRAKQLPADVVDHTMRVLWTGRVQYRQHNENT